MEKLTNYVVDHFGQLHYKSSVLDNKIYPVYGIGRYGLLHGKKADKNKVDYYEL